jgi:glycosyltransferase involved in cell wall biosynthesis
MFSIIIPLYDKATQITATLTAVRCQTLTAYEVVIIDDASTDGSPSVVRDYLRNHPDFASRVRLISQTHAGAAAARNTGIRESRYDWLAFLDADDTWAPEYLQAQYNLSLTYPFCEVLAAAYEFNHGDGRFTPARFSKLPFHGAYGLLDNYFEVAACSHPPLTSISTIVRKKSLQAINCFPEGVYSGEDLLTWARLAVNCRIAFNKTPLGIHNIDRRRFNHDQQTRMPAKEDMVGGNLERIFHQHPKIRGLRAYVGSWHKMRTRIYLSHSMKKEAWKEWTKLVRFNPVNYKTWAYLLLLASPVKILS